MEMEMDLTFKQFCDEWLLDITAGEPNTIELGNRFSRKLLTQWLDIDDSTDEVIYCDGSGDGGIDVAYLDEGNSDDDIDSEGHRWYLVQSKYGKAFQGTNTLLKESEKLIDTLDDPRVRLSSITRDFIERLHNFIRRKSDRDRIILVFATINPLTKREQKTLSDIRAMGINRIGTIFDVEAVSVDTIYQRTLESKILTRSLSIPIELVGLPDSFSPDDNLLVCSVSLLGLYNFLDYYQQKTCDIDQLYEKNLRRFLGGRGKVNLSIQQTLKEEPERFGLFNNGITIVVTDFRKSSDNTLRLTDPYIVNGCQTTRTIWDVCRQRLRSGGTGSDHEMDKWRSKVSQGIVVTKIVRIGQNDEKMLEKITRYTNSQNAVKEKDFIALDRDFKSWKQDMEVKYKIFLEIQRGAWESQAAWQKQHPGNPAFDKHANAFDLIKVYGSGWLGEAGTAFGRNAAFLPNGMIFKRIVNNDDLSSKLDADDLFAAYQLQKATDVYGFGRTAEKDTRRLSRYLFYLVTINLLKLILINSGVTEPTPKEITNALNKLFESGNQTQLLDIAIQAIDEYMMQGTSNSIFDEPMLKKLNGNINGFLKSEWLGKVNDCPVFKQLIGDYGRLMGRPYAKDQLSAQDTILGLISSDS